MSKPTLPLLILSLDIEDWPQSTWDHTLPITERAARNTEKVLDILAEHGRVVTMFVLGKFAESYPAVVRRIAAAGHEVASHGYGHIEVFKQTRADFEADIPRSKSFLEDLIGQPVVGYRAPDYSVTGDCLWALDVLAEAGFEYDSSIFPSGYTRYGIPDWTTEPARVRLPSGHQLVEFPLTTLDFLGRRWPVAGGGYHRLLPWPVIRRAIARRINQDRVFMTYGHPYEFAPDELNELDLDLPLKTRLHQGLGRRGFQAKFEKMLATFENSLACQVARQIDWPEYHH